MRIATIATSLAGAGRSHVVLERDGKYLVTESWPGMVHDEEVVVHEVRVPD